MKDINRKNSDYKYQQQGYIEHSSGEEETSERSPLLFDNLIWLTTKEAAVFLRKSNHALRQMLYSGKITARKLHGRLYFKKSELHELVDISFY
jgi:excisionase family DNA binding protein